MNQKATHILLFTAVFCLILISNMPHPVYAGKITYDTAGTYDFTVPTGVQTITVKVWGSGGNNGGIPSAGGTGGTGTGWTVSRTYATTLPSIYPGGGNILSNANGMLVQLRVQ